MDASAPLLKVSDLSVYFQQKSKGKLYALKNINFSLDKGKVLGIVGETGAGKTVLAQSILNLAEPGIIERGAVVYRGQNLLQMPPSKLRKLRGKEISMIFPDPATCFDPLFTVGNQIVDTIRAHESVSKREAKERAIHLLEMVGIPSPHHRFNEYPFQFSGGMIQRAMIAAAISSNPELIIADNPTQALDVTIQAQILELLVELKEKLATTIIFISHNLGVVSQVADDVLVLYSGQVIEYGSKQQVLKHARHPYTQALIRSVPEIRGPREERLPTIPQLRTVRDDNGCIFRAKCPLAAEQCAAAPPLESVGEHHQAACWMKDTG